MRRMMALAIVAGFLLAGPAQAQDKKDGEGEAVPVHGVRDQHEQRPEGRHGRHRARAALTTDEEREALIAAFVEGGQNMLLKALQKVKPRVGYIRTPNSLGYDLQYA